MTYPKVMSEFETLRRAAASSIARFGDGELRLALGGDCVSQRERSPHLAAELRDMLHAARSGCLVCIPNAAVGPKQGQWASYTAPRFTSLYGRQEYGSAFITRPDSAPWIDTPEYWSSVRDLWRDADVVLVVGDKKSLSVEMMAGEARSVREVIGPRQNAYAEIDRIEEEIGNPAGVVILCLGATATVLAWRLAAKGVHALDLGHIGMFMKHAGCYIERDRLISNKYLKQNRLLHEAPAGFGGSGWKHAQAIVDFAREIAAKSILDYGCGECTLRPAIKKLGFRDFIGEYDPARFGKEAPPKPADLVVCTDVMEHVEPALVDNVLRHIRGLAGRGCFMVVATRPANKILPNGENAHLIVASAEWWIERITAAGLTVIRSEEKRKGNGAPHEVRVWLRP